MPATKARQLSRLRVTFGLVVVIVLVLDGITLFVRHHDAKPVSVHDAVSKYRADVHHTPTPAVTPTSTPKPTPTPTATATIGSTPAIPPETQTSGAGQGTTAPVSAASPSASSSSVPAAPQSSAPAGTTHPTPTPSRSPATLPPQGVYSYATTGSESIGIPGGTRSYPSTSTVTVENTGCGVSEDWQPSTEHSETRQLCLHHGSVRLAGFSTEIAFFGVGSTESYKCGTDAIVYSPSTPIGHSTSFSCSSSDSVARQMVTPVGYDTITVGGTAVRTLHISVESTLTGKNEGTSSQQLWLTTGHSVLVKNIGRIDAMQGGVNYHERYTLRLSRLTPQQ